MKFGELRLTTTSLLFLFATSAINGFTNSDENNLSQSQEEELTIVGGASANDDYNCGLSNMGLPGRRVLHGRDTIDGDWPWVVFLNPGCTGSIISNKHILSAAHCAFNISDISVIAGASNISSHSKERQRIPVAKIFIHPLYDYHDFTSPDVAVYELANELKFGRAVRKICLPRRFKESYGQIAFIVGWGADTRTDDTKKSFISQEAAIPLNPPKRCVNQFRNLTEVLEFDRKQFLCGGGTFRGTEIGDSGGPLMLNVKGRWFQVGLTSFGEMGKTEPNGYYYDVGAYTRIAENCPWIAEMTAHNVKCLDMKDSSF
ncbi:trypsin domain-containing protein [Ditylenchus destructor]|uniref:Trypsin domain-containing protein n=1 Tax=Ditylenchus destructor TaxID=166010 RepID=A0AAD4NHC0_9BILA|nr:trypsin domain-containing protein [Ditylenchus destructor]